MQDYEKRELFNLFEAIEYSSKEDPAILKNKDFQFELATLKSDASENFSLTVRNDEDVLFVLDLVKYDKYHFCKNVHQPFDWDGDARDRYSEEEWEDFMSEKKIWSDCPIEVSVRIQDLKISDENTIDNIIRSIDLEDVLENLYQNLLSDSLDTPTIETTSVAPVTPEEKAIFSVMNKINTINKRN